MPYDRGDLVSRAHQEGEVLAVRHGQDGTELTARVPPGLAAELAGSRRQRPPGEARAGRRDCREYRIERGKIRYCSVGQ